MVGSKLRGGKCLCLIALEKGPPRLNMADHLMAASPQSLLRLQSTTAPAGMKGLRKKPIKGFGDRIPAGPHASIDSWRRIW